MIFNGNLDDIDLANDIFDHSNVMPNRKKSSQVIKFSDKDREKKSESKLNSFDEISKIMLKIWVKVKNGWSDNESVLPSMGYDISK